MLTLSTAAWALDRNLSARDEFNERYGTLDMKVYEYTASHAAHVRLIDLTAELPGIFGGLA